MTRKPFYDSGLRFECQMCGNCCRVHGEFAYVYLRESDVLAMAAHLELDRAVFLERYCQQEDGWTIVRMDDPACPFLDERNRCRVYPVRPKQCATWPFWQENLTKKAWEGPVRDCCPGIGRGPLHSKAEIERIAAETEAFYEEGDREAELRAHD